MFIPLVWPSAHYNAFSGRANEPTLLSSTTTSLHTMNSRPSQSSSHPWGSSSSLPPASRPSGSSSHLTQPPRPSGSSFRPSPLINQLRPSQPSHDSDGNATVHASTIRRVHLTQLTISILIGVLSLLVLALAADTIRSTKPDSITLDSRTTTVLLATSTIAVFLSFAHLLFTLIPQGLLPRFHRVNIFFTISTAIGLFLSVFALVFNVVVEGGSDASTLVGWSCSQDSRRPGHSQAAGRVCGEGKAVVGLMGFVVFMECVAVGGVVAGWWVAGKVGREVRKEEVGSA